MTLAITSDTGLNRPASPNLPLATGEYSRQYQDQLNNVLRLYFNRLDAVLAQLGFGQAIDYLDFKTTATFPPAMARLGWNNTDQTLDLGMEYDVTQQIGLEYYARVQNNTGVTIPNGTVVGFAGAVPDSALSVAPYLANGATPSLYILGVMTHDLPDTGEKGYCTAWGFVRDVNTSAFALGDILYASPTTAGAFTNIKPTAPNNVIPLAAVLKVGTTDGIIFVRPTIEQQQYYGTFADRTTQTLAAAYTPQAITFNTTETSLGISRGTPTSRIVTSTAGFYNFQFSAQISSSNASSKKLWIWPRKNGTDIADSGSEITVSGGGTVLVPAWNWTVSMGANDYFQIMWAAEDVSVQLITVAAQTGANGTATFARPAVPSMILTVTQVQQ